ncbi:MAG: hemolysin family protein [Proteobacteria bacterium]|nr:hemolysin family protein [Pseudomonadota bacterium]
MYSLLFTYFALAVMVSFLCSLWEAVLLSITPSYAQVKLEEGTRVGQLIESFKQNVDRPLAAILTLNTIAHTVGAVGVGEQAVRIWADANPLITGVAVPVLLTLGILILSEIIPKTIGANFWKELAPFTVRSLQVVILFLYPLVMFSQLITRRLKKDKEASVLTRSDFTVLAQMAARAGVFEHGEADIILSLLRFRSVRARSAMTPRTVLFAESEDLRVVEFHQQHGDIRFTRIPVYAGDDAEEITGFVRKDDVFRALAEGRGDEKLAALRREILVVPDTASLTALFKRLRNDREHIAILVDEFGGVAGIVTMEDVIETLLGLEILDESDIETDMQAEARRSWERRARRLGLVGVGTPPKGDVDKD